MIVGNISATDSSNWIIVNGIKRFDTDRYWVKVFGGRIYGEPHISAEESMDTDIEIYHKNYSYRNGIASWGDGDDAVYVHFGVFPPRCGGKTLDNAYPMEAAKFFWHADIFKIKTVGEPSLYYIHVDGFNVPFNHILLGRRADGVWVKYFDTDTLSDTYFGTNRKGGPRFENMEIMEEDTIVMIYSYDRGGSVIEEGEFCFKWDDKAQWFSVDHVVY